MQKCLRLFLLLVALPRAVWASDEEQSNLGFDVFTNFAPLLALFGDQFARQYMSESLLLLDHIVFAVAPLGVLTAIVSAIRVSGPKWAIAFIGRAREPRSVAEMELMSSTSAEVCEVFNGDMVVRTTESPKVRQFIFFPDSYDHKHKTCGLHTLESAHASGLMEITLFGVRPTWRKQGCPERGWMRNTVSEISNHNVIRKTSAFHTPLGASAPNLRLNLPHTARSRMSKSSELWNAAVTGIIIQLTVIMTGAVTSYHSSVRRSVGGTTSKSAFPLFLAGTVNLFTSMFLCSWIIDQNSMEHVWRRTLPADQNEGAATDGTNESSSAATTETSSAIRSENNRQRRLHRSRKDTAPKLFWLQQKLSLNDQDLYSCLILGGTKDQILTSSRIHPARSEKIPTSTGINNKYELFTICATVMGLAGILMQFEGLRSLSWPTAVAQLLSTLIMALIRALIRRDIGERPPAIRALENFELDWLALRLVYQDSPLDEPKMSDDPETPDGSEISASNPLSLHCRLVIQLGNGEEPPFMEEGNFTSPGTADGCIELQHPHIAPKSSLAAEGGSVTMEPLFFERSCQMAIRVRERLEELTQCTSILSTSAVALSKAIALVLHEIDSGDKVDFQWTVPARIEPSDRPHGAVFERVPLHAHKDCEGLWSVVASEIDALMSLWIASFASDSSREHDVSVERRVEGGPIEYCRILGANLTPIQDSQKQIWSNSHINTDILSRDLAWWTKTAIHNSIQPIGPDLKLTIGFKGVDGLSKLGGMVSTSSKAPVGTIFVLHVFSAFMWAVSGFISADYFRTPSLDVGQTELPAPEHRETNFKANNSQLMKLVDTVQSCGFGTTEEILLCIIPPLSFRGLLPSETMIQPMLRKARHFKVLLDWQRLAEIFLDILRLDMDPRRGDRVAYEVAVELIEFLFMGQQAVDDRRGQSDSEMLQVNDRSKALETAVERTKSQLAFHPLLSAVVNDLSWFLSRQRRLGPLRRISSELKRVRSAQSEEFTGLECLPKGLELMRLANFSKLHQYCSKSHKGDTELTDIDLKFATQPDIFGWYPLHYATVGDDERLFDQMLRTTHRFSPTFDLKTKCGRTPLHFAAMFNPGRIKKLAYGQEMAKSAAKLRAEDGTIPIHCAAREGNIDSVRRLIQYSDIATADALGRTPLVLAVINGHEDVVDVFLHNDTNQNLALMECADELSRRTPLHFALVHNHFSIAMQLISRGQGLMAISIPDLEDITPITLVFSRNNDELVNQLLKWLPCPDRDTVVNSYRATNCFISIMKHAIVEKREGILKLLIAHIIARKWDDKWIFESFSIAYREKQMDMLFTLLNIVDALCIDNTPEKLNTWPDKARNYLRSDLKLKESAVLISAIQNGNSAIISRMIDEGLIERKPNRFNWNEQDSSNRSPLAWIAKVKPSLFIMSHVMTLKERENTLNLIWSKWNVEQRRNALNERQGRYKKTPLMYAVKNQLESIVRLFVNAGASVREVDERGMSALAYAFRGINRNIWVMLVERDPNGVNERRGYYETTALIDAVRSCRMDIVEFLSTCEKIDPNVGDIDGDNALAWCSINANADMVNILIDTFLGIDPHRGNKNGLSPLMKVFINFRFKRDKTTKRILCKLMSAKCTDPRGYDIYLMLLDTVFRKDIELLKLLFDMGADSRTTDDAGRPLIALAALYGNVELVKLVRENMSSSKPARKRLYLALHACVQRYVDDGENIMDFLRPKGDAAHIWDNSNWSVLECASRAGNEKMERKLKCSRIGLPLPRKKKAPFSWAISLNNPFLTSPFESLSGLCCFELTAPFPKELSELDSPWLVVRANHCIPVYQSSYYWEVRVANSPANDPIAIGICAERSNFSAMPGWPGSAAYFYHGNSGEIFTGRGKGMGTYETNALFCKGDTVGCCVNAKDCMLFFTRNGEKIGPTIPLRDDLRGQLYPCVGLYAGASAVGTIIKANFGGVSSPHFLLDRIPESIASSAFSV